MYELIEDEEIIVKTTGLITLFRVVYKKDSAIVD